MSPSFYNSSESQILENVDIDLRAKDEGKV